MGVFLLLIEAAKEGNTECVKLLLEAGADIEKTSVDGQTPLHRAACYGHSECVKLLLAAGAAVDKPDYHGKTPLCLATEKNNSECVKLLYDTVTHVNSGNKDKQTTHNQKTKKISPENTLIPCNTTITAKQAKSHRIAKMGCLVYFIIMSIIIICSAVYKYYSY